MPRLSKVLLIALLMLAGSHSLRAQLSGIISVPSVSYPTLASVVGALNTQGVGSGGLVVNLTTGNPQTAPAGGYLLGSATLNASTSATNAITINGNGNMVTAGIGTSTATDGIFIIQGVDYLTINSLNLSESPLNLTATTQMEWGFALLKKSSATPFDGCQYVTIQGCTITLNRANTASTGIYAANHTATSTSPLTITAATDANSYNKCYGNTIQNCYFGISFSGYSSLAYLDLSNDIGGSSLSTGNLVQNFGGGTLGQVGISVNAQSGCNISRNTVSNAGGGGVAGGNAVLAGILYTSTGTITVQNNSITLQQGTTGNTGAVVGIGDATGGTAVSTAISGNTITGTGGGTGLWYGIEIAGGNPLIDITNNAFKDINLSTTAVAHLIHITQSISPNTINVTGNTMTGTATPYFQKAAGNNFAFYYNTVSAATTLSNISGNTVTQAALSGATTFYGIYALDASKKSVFNNTVSSIAGGTSAMYPLSASSADTSRVYGNTVSGVSGGGIIYCINMTTVLNAYVYKNKITSVSGLSTNATVYGVYCNTAAGTFNVYNNFFTDLTAPATSSNTGVNGIYGAAGTVNAYENTIVLGKAAAISGGANFSCAGVYSSSPLKLRDNIIYVNATPSGTGVAACIKRNTVANPVGTPPASSAFSADNNVYYINPTAQSYIYVEGITTTTVKNGYGISALTANTTTNIMNDPQFNRICGAYKTFIAPDGESSSFFENNITSLGSGLYQPSGISYAESGGVAIAADDYASITRSNPPDIGALQFSGTAIAPTTPTITYTPLPNQTVCAAPSLIATITGAGSNTINTTTALPRLYYKKSTEANAFGNYPTDNTSSFNGWKYVSATGTAPGFSFAIDYTKLTSAFAVNDTIQYFVVAEDNAATPNVALSAAGFTQPYCLGGVNIPPAAGSIAAFPAVNKFVLLPPPPFRVSASDTICRNMPTAAGVTSTLSNYPNYSWSPLTGLYTDAAGTIPYTGGSAATVYIRQPAAGVTVYTVLATNGTAQCLATAKDTITVLPIDTTVTGRLAFCAGDSSILTAASGNTGYTYQWLRNDTLITGATASRYTVRSSGNYSVAITDAGGCPDTSGRHFILAIPLPVPLIDTTGGVLHVSGAFTTFEWRLNDTAIAGATAGRYTPVVSGSYTVAVTDVNGCRGVSAPVSITVSQTGVSGPAGNYSLRIYPNPAQDALYVTAAIPVTIRINGVDGKLLLRSAASGAMDISALADGLYIVTVTDSAGRLLRVEKLVKRR